MAVTTPAVRPQRAPPKFVTGSLLGHILVMTGTGAVGLVAIFIGDLANILFLSWLRDEAVVAAVGYASSILFFTISIGIGLSIAATAVVSAAIGAGQRTRARRLTVNAHIATFVVSALLGLAVWYLVPYLLGLIGAKGRTLALAGDYLDIIVPSLPMLALAMTSAAVLRSVGDARRAMNITLTIAFVNTLLDPILILWLGLGVTGAAIASVVARAAAMGVALHGVVNVHNLMGRPKLATFRNDLSLLAVIAVPAVLTNVATPVANAYVTAAIAPFGDSAVAGWAIIGRILPVAFGAIYALSGSIGPILGQNYGARDGSRLTDAFTLSLAVNVAFTILAWLVIAVLARPIAALFHATGEAEALILLFCRWQAPLFAFMGALFVANAAFNTLGRPHVPTLLNWGRATLGTVPVVMAGAALGGAAGVVWAFMVGAVPFGVLAVALCYRLIRSLTAEAPTAGEETGGAADG